MIRFALKNRSIWNKQKALLTLQRNGIHSGQHIQQAGFGKYLVILTPLAVGGGVVAYAKNDKQFRKSLVETVPGIDSVLKVLLQEEGNAVSEVKKSIDSATQKVVDAKDTVASYFGSETKHDEKPAPVKATPSKSTASPSSAAPPLPSITAPAPSKQASPKPEKKTVVSSNANATPVAATPPPSEPVKLPPVAALVLPSSLTELEKSIEVAGNIAAREYKNAIKHLHEYANDVKTVVDRVIEHNDPTAWSSLKNKTSARDTAVEAAERTAQEARAQLEKLEKHVAVVAKNVAPELLEKTRRNIRVIGEELSKSKDELYNAKDSANLSEKYWKKVEEARNYFVDQVETLFPGIDLSTKKLNLDQNDIDLLILHAYSHVLAYQKELQKIHAEGEICLRRALEALKGEDQTEAVNRQLEYLLAKEKQELNIENQKRLFHIQAENEAKLRQQLKQQSEAHADHLEDAVNEKEKELRRIFNRELNEKLSVEQATYKLQLASMLGRLRGMDAALKERADADRQVHQAQALWSACSALWSSTRAVDPQLPWQSQLRPLSHEVEAVKRASAGDELVKIVLDGLPETAKTRGVYPENAIRERFLKVEKLARQLALVTDESDGLPTYALSYLQAALIIQPKELISQAELNNEPVDISQLNTFDILNRTRYYVDRGNFLQALKYANLLKGASRNVASEWINETRLLVETQQAVNVLLSHAATSGLSFL